MTSYHSSNIMRGLVGGLGADKVYLPSRGLHISNAAIIIMISICQSLTTTSVLEKTEAFADFKNVQNVF